MDLHELLYAHAYEEHITKSILQDCGSGIETLWNSRIQLAVHFNVCVLIHSSLINVWGKVDLEKSGHHTTSLGDTA